MLANVGDMAFKARIKMIFEYLNVQPGDKVLDCGCGEGFYLKLLEKLYPEAKFWGVDYDPEILGRAKREVSARVKLMQGDIYRLPFKKNYFDKIILSEVIEHLDDDLKALRLVKNILKKGGALAITVPNANYPFFWDPVNKVLEKVFKTHVKQGFWAGIWNMHLRLYDYDQLISLCKKAGLKISRADLMTHHCFPFNHLFLYGFKQILNKGVLPEKMSLSADKFTWEKADKNQKLDVVKLGYRFLNWVDSFNDRQFSPEKSSVGLAIKAVKE
jgi:ubiquinone/menaquinone biosynthesis C-methylase UbiE